MYLRNLPCRKQSFKELGCGPQAANPKIYLIKDRPLINPDDSYLKKVISPADHQ